MSDIDKIKQRVEPLKEYLNSGLEDGWKSFSLSADETKWLLDSVTEMAEALEYWIAFEEACIKRDGPYTSVAITQRINRAKEALAKVAEGCGDENI